MAAQANSDAADRGLTAGTAYTTASKHRSKASDRYHKLTNDIDGLTAKVKLLRVAKVGAKNAMAAADVVMAPNLATLIATDKIVAKTAGDVDVVATVIGAGFEGTVYATDAAIALALRNRGIAVVETFEED